MFRVNSVYADNLQCTQMDFHFLILLFPMIRIVKDKCSFSCLLRFYHLEKDTHDK